MATIPRTGTVNFLDAGLAIWEDGISDARAAGGYHGEKAWTRQFKRDVFSRIVQQLNRLGWTLEIPDDYVKEYGLAFARNRRRCAKGDLKGWLEVSGRTISFKMWQSINTPTRPDHGGQYELNKEAVMPYVLRLEMERTRRRIRDYLCGVMEGYAFNPSKPTHRPKKPLEHTAIEIIEQHYTESWHFKGDWPKYVEQHSATSMIDCFNSNRESADGVLLQHGQRVYFFDWHGRICTGIAYYNINNMWWVVTGQYDYTNKACFELRARLPNNPRVKRNKEQRRKRLEGELATAIKAMNFERASVLRDILFPKKDPLFVVWHNEHKAYHCANFRGYTTNMVDAGKFTAAELKGYREAPNKIIALEAA